MEKYNIIGDKYPIAELFKKIEKLEITSFKEILNYIGLEILYELNTVYGMGAVYRFKEKFRLAGIKVNKVQRNYTEMKRDVDYLKLTYPKAVVIDLINENKIQNLTDLNLTITGVKNGAYLLDKLYSEKDFREILKNLKGKEVFKTPSSEEVMESIKLKEIRSVKQFLIKTYTNSYEAACKHYGIEFTYKIFNYFYVHSWETTHRTKLIGKNQILALIAKENITSRSELENNTRLPFRRREICFFYPEQEMKEIHQAINPTKKKILGASIYLGYHDTHRMGWVKQASKAKEFMDQYDIIDGPTARKILKSCYDPSGLQTKKKIKNK